MVTLDGTIGDGAAGFGSFREIFAVSRHTWILRGAASLALAVATAGGAVGAGFWLSSHESINAAKPPVVVAVRPTVVAAKPPPPLPGVPARAILRVPGQ